MVKTVITISDYGQINGGEVGVAIEGAIALSDIVEESIFFHSSGEPDERLKSSNVKVISLRQCDLIKNPNPLKASIQGIWNRKAKNELKKLLFQKNPEETIVHIHSWSHAISSSVFKMIERMGFKTVVTVHDYFLVCPNGGLYNFKKNIVCNFNPLSSRCILCNCDKRRYIHKLWRVIRQIVQNNSIEKRKNISFIFVSDFSRKIIENYKRFDRNFRVNNPILIDDRIKVDAENNDTYLYIGRLSEEKGVDFFCRVISELGLKGTVVGDGHMMQNLKKKYPQIEFVGWQSRYGVRKYILKARALVFPSLWYETLGMTILEAASFGIPSVVSDICAGSELTDEELVFHVNDIDSAKSVICSLSDNKKVRELSIKNYEAFSCESNTALSYAERLLKIYNSILEIAK